MSKLVENLAAELERPRELSARVLNYISGTYEVDHDAVGAFLVDQLPKLEDDEIDLILSPVFTPKLSDQTAFAEILGGESLPVGKQLELVQQLVARPLRAKLLTPDSRVHSVILREVTVDRFVRRLRLEGAIPEVVLHLIEQVPSITDRPTLKAIARRAVWENEGPRQILARYLGKAVEKSMYGLDDAMELLRLVEARKPVDFADLMARISGWKKTLREQIDVGSGARPFFNEDVRMMHGGGRDQRIEDGSRVSPKERELEFLIRLEGILG